MSKNTTSKTATETPEIIAPEIGEYNGKPTMTLKRMANDRFPFSFGMGKARLIVQHFDAIKKFVADNDKPAPAAK